jgi:type IV fimbrial biogenesis protein FimT
VQKGFTLIELLATIAVATILLSIATPSFIETSRRNRLTTYANDLIATVNLARSEAIRRGAPVTICHSNDAKTCSGGWSNGWIVFADLNGDGAIDSDTDPILRTHEALSASYALGTDDSFKDVVTFGADGAATDVGVFAFCQGGKKVGARAVILTRLRPRTARDTDGDGVPNTDAGNIASCTTP